ncbi:MAG: radical SAM family heme chaperone HemW [Clostridia bacterium]|nr:radical SAM family heme chaperone HemW [Clostridia bacterium]
MDRTKTGIYIHIPFCRSKCPYCDFYSLASSECSEQYLTALCNELSDKKRLKEYTGEVEGIEIDTVYFGGGTPSLMTPYQLSRVLKAVRTGFDISSDCEITLECNPSSKGLSELLFAAADEGVNRISLGMQSSSDCERRLLGRRGGVSEVENAVKAAKKAGISNISLDVMIGVPDSNEDTVRASLDKAMELDAKHISAYILKIEEGTYYYKHRERYNFPDEDKTADMYLFMSEYLRNNGYIHYEISNFCRDGFHSRHNMKYWDGVPYLGFGPGAHSFFNGKRFYFPRDINAFISESPAVYDGDGGDEEEKILLSLRTFRGISLDKRSDSFIKKAELYEKYGYGKISDGNFSLTPEGYLISNTIISELLSVN